MNAHGPGTKQCDTAEAAVLDALFPDAEGIFSVKPLAGHCQAAAGSVELLASLYGFERGVIPAPPRVAKGHPRLLDGPTACVEGPDREVVSRHGRPQRRAWSSRPPRPDGPSPTPRAPTVTAGWPPSAPHLGSGP